MNREKLPAVITTTQSDFSDFGDRKNLVSPTGTNGDKPLVESTRAFEQGLPVDDIRDNEEDSNLSESSLEMDHPVAIFQDLQNSSDVLQDSALNHRINWIQQLRNSSSLEARETIYDSDIDGSPDSAVTGKRYQDNVVHYGSDVSSECIAPEKDCPPSAESPGKDKMLCDEPQDEPQMLLNKNCNGTALYGRRDGVNSFSDSSDASQQSENDDGDDDDDRSITEFQDEDKGFIMGKHGDSETRAERRSVSKSEVKKRKRSVAFQIPSILQDPRTEWENFLGIKRQKTQVLPAQVSTVKKRKPSRKLRSNRKKVESEDGLYSFEDLDSYPESVKMLAICPPTESEQSAKLKLWNSKPNLPADKTSKISEVAGTDRPQQFESPPNNPQQKSYLSDTATATSTIQSPVSVGTRISLYWEGDDAFYEGTIIYHRSTRRKNLLLHYDDGETEWVDLTKERYRVVSVPEANSTRYELEMTHPLSNPSEKARVIQHGDSESEEALFQEVGGHDVFMVTLFRILNDKDFDSTISWTGPLTFKVHDELQLEDEILMPFFGVVEVNFFHRSLASRGFLFCQDNRTYQHHYNTLRREMTVADVQHEFAFEERLQFPDQLYHVLQDKTVSTAIRWCDPYKERDSFEIVNMETLEERVLGKYFYYLSEPRLQSFLNLLKCWAFDADLYDPYKFSRQYFRASMQKKHGKVKQPITHNLLMGSIFSRSIPHDSKANHMVSSQSPSMNQGEAEHPQPESLPKAEEKPVVALTQPKKRRPKPFLPTLLSILNNNKYKSIVRWSTDNSFAFEVHSIDRLACEILPEIFLVTETPLLYFKKALASRGFTSPKDGTYQHPKFHAALATDAVKKLDRGHKSHQLINYLYKALMDEDLSDIIQRNKDHYPEYTFEILDVNLFLSVVLPSRFFFLPDFSFKYFLNQLRDMQFDQLDDGSKNRIRFRHSSIRFRTVKKDAVKSTLSSKGTAGKEGAVLSQKKKTRQSRRKLFNQLALALKDESVSHIFSWSTDGFEIVIRDRKLFADVVIPKYFPTAAKNRQSSFTSRMVNSGFRGSLFIKKFRHPTFTCDTGEGDYDQLIGMHNQFLVTDPVVPTDAEYKRFFGQLSATLGDGELRPFIDWTDNGEAIRIGSRDGVTNFVLPKYFPTKAKSPILNFIARLCRYGFCPYPDISSKSDMFHNPTFTRDRNAWDTIVT